MRKLTVFKTNENSRNSSTRIQDNIKISIKEWKTNNQRNCKSIASVFKEMFQRFISSLINSHHLLN
jgi:hypothetical protein